MTLGRHQYSMQQLQRRILVSVVLSGMLVNTCSGVFPAKTEEVQEDRGPLSPSPPTFPSPSPSPAPMLPPSPPLPLPLPRSKLSDSIIAPLVEMDVHLDEKAAIDPMEDIFETEQVQVMLQEQEVTDEVGVSLVLR